MAKNGPMMINSLFSLFVCCCWLSCLFKPGRPASPLRSPGLFMTIGFSLRTLAKRSPSHSHTVSALLIEIEETTVVLVAKISLLANVVPS